MTINHPTKALEKAFKNGVKNNGGKTKPAGIEHIFQKQNLTIPKPNTAVLNEYNIIFAIGFKLQKAVKEAAKQNPDAHFAIIDSVVEQPKVASINYKDQEASIPCRVAALV